MASRAVGSTYPNPPVGAIIVKDKTIISRGWTQPYGSTHAEMHAIKQVRNKKLLKGATLYCTLEPCYHRGKNPPCVHAIIKYKFAKVVISEIDKNPKVNAKSINLLKKAGIKVSIKSFGKEISQLNRVFFNTLKKNEPFVTLKIASTADAKIATKSFQSKWITNESSRLKGHQLRFLNDCILVGSGTVKKDNPLLDCRVSGLNNFSPDIFILDTNLKLDKDLKIFSLKNRKIYVFYSKNKVCKPINKKNITYLPLKKKNGMLDIHQALKEISKLGYMKILVEGGAKLSSTLLKYNLINELHWFRASKILGGDGLAAISSLGISKVKNMRNFQLISYENYENDQLSVYRRNK